MAKKLLKIVNDYPESKVLAVVGGGHMEGIAELLEKSGYKALEPGSGEQTGDKNQKK
jgi:pheromone shutdown protein TraB